jgi:hypothetical protein
MAATAATHDAVRKFIFQTPEGKGIQSEVRERKINRGCPKTERAQILVLEFADIFSHSQGELFLLL